MGRPAWIDEAIQSAVRAFKRNPRTSRRREPVPANTRPVYAEDGLWTHHGHTFVEDEGFRRAYARAVRAGGFDYEIRWRVHTLLWAARLASAVDGAFVECGTGRGFMASAICEHLDWTDRPFYLYDTFEPALPDDAGDQTGPISRYYASSVSDVLGNFAEWPGVRLVVGRIPGTLADSPARVAFLHVDLNNAPAESAAVNYFWPRMSAGAVLVFDDYGFEGFEASREAADALGRVLGFSVLASPTGQGIVIKSMP